MVEERRQSDIVNEAFAALRQSQAPDGPTTHALEQTLQAVRQAQQKPSRTSFKERIRNVNKFIKYSVAAAAAVALVIGATLFFRHAESTAYAIEQTVEANHAVRTVHLTNESGQLAEAWAQFDDRGNLEHYRGDFPKTEDGAKVVCWQKDKASVWFKDKKSYLTVREPDMLAKFSKGFFDPKQQVDDLYQAQAKAEVTVRTEQPSKSGEMIRLTVDYAKSTERRDVYMVDPQTKLLKEVERYTRKGDTYDLAGKTVYLDYNKPIDPKVFAPDIPADVTRVDQTTQIVGLEQGTLSEKEIVVKVAQEFFEAWNQKDYAKMGQLMEGFPADKLEQTMGNAQGVRIISIGQPYKVDGFGPVAYRVECQVEIKTPQGSETRTFKPGIRPVYNHPDRWTIFGGI